MDNKLTNPDNNLKPISPQAAAMTAAKDTDQAPDPAPNDQVTYYRVDLPDGSPRFLMREVKSADNSSLTLQTVDPLGVWRYNGKLDYYLQNGEADKITDTEAQRIKSEHFNLSLREYSDLIKQGLEST